MMFGAAASLSWLTARLAADALPLAEYRPFFMILAVIVGLYAYALMAFRLFLRLRPLPIGEIAENSSEEFTYHVYLLFFLILFYPVMRSGAMPVPFMRLFYQALGARLGPNTYSSGLLLDPPFVQLGANCIVGQYALVVPHVIEGRRLAHYPITIGDNVTIGAGACVLAGVTIGDNAIVSTGAVVTKGTHISAGEVWGGVPAKRLGARDSTLGSSSQTPHGDDRHEYRRKSLQPH